MVRDPLFDSTDHAADGYLQDARELLPSDTVALLVGKAIVAELRDVRRDLSEIHAKLDAMHVNMRSLDDHVTR